MTLHRLTTLRRHQPQVSVQPEVTYAAVDNTAIQSLGNISKDRPQYVTCGFLIGRSASLYVIDFPKQERRAVRYLIHGKIYSQQAWKTKRTTEVVYNLGSHLYNPSQVNFRLK